MISKDDYLKTIKIGILGESSVGKQLLARKFCKESNFDFNLSSIGIEYFVTKRILSDGNKYKITILDTTGQERFRSISLNSIRSYDGSILMYDITNRKSFYLIDEWIENIYDIFDKDYPLVLIGNNCDLEDKREVSIEEGIEAAEKLYTIYFETSAKEGINVEKPFDELLNKIINNKKFKENRKESSNNIVLNNRTKGKVKYKGKYKIKDKGKYKEKEKEKGKEKEKEKEGKGKDKKINKFLF